MKNLVRVVHSGVSRFIDKDNSSDLRFAAQAGGVIETDDEGGVVFYAPEDISATGIKRKESVEDIFGIASKPSKDKGKADSTEVTIPDPKK
jgi:hypothetical protein